ncbi:5,6-dimethylbenzimidazole synthase [Methyloceanibacter sp.]|uniref:5,6-dimethylbenzimidazole synthase n=1 Tax=Methyloceanibacter sp. TaxID=1965321 RepID=UPI00208C97B5|nr:5,6-dimethylbenzimidazole synthase [Methyloceanibacter sp.]GFO80664.1 MAG: oxidoreductase [Methyloceanibacter sp.]HML92712.1 5,6-dimethylbenzimidazole synthase [Methyloceanibacter sp.]
MKALGPQFEQRRSDPDDVPSPPKFDEDFLAQLHELLRWRRDVRRFKRDPLPEGTIGRLLSLACLAPSVGLSEPWRFVLVESSAARAAIRANFEACNSEALSMQEPDRAALYARLKLQGMDEAPVQIAVFADRETVQGYGLGRLTMPETIDYSVVTAVHTFWLAARAEGIGVGWVSILDPSGVKAALDVPEDWIFVGYLCVGYPQAQDDRPTLERAGWEYRHPTEGVILRR